MSKQEKKRIDKLSSFYDIKTDYSTQPTHGISLENASVIQFIVTEEILTKKNKLGVRWEDLEMSIKTDIAQEVMKRINNYIEKKYTITNFKCTDSFRIRSLKRTNTCEKKATRFKKSGLIGEDYKKMRNMNGNTHASKNNTYLVDFGFFKGLYKRGGHITDYKGKMKFYNRNEGSILVSMGESV